MLNFTKYFDKECEIYIQNVSGVQVSLQMDVGNGRFENWLFDPSGAPVNLTQHFPFEVLKRSMDLRKMLSRRPAALKLLTEDEFKAIYSNIAKERGLFTSDAKSASAPDIDAAIEAIDTERHAIQSHIPLPADKTTSTVDDASSHLEPATKAPLMIDDIVHPRVLHLCNQVKSELPEQERMPANQLLQELKAIEMKLKQDDWEHIRANGQYPSIKKYAKAKLAATVGSD
jgi:hypothetical protein